MSGKQTMSEMDITTFFVSSNSEGAICAVGSCIEGVAQNARIESFCPAKKRAATQNVDDL